LINSPAGVFCDQWLSISGRAFERWQVTGVADVAQSHAYIS